MLTGDEGLIDQHSDYTSQFMNCQCSHNDYFDDEESIQIPIGTGITPSSTTSPSFLAFVDDRRPPSNSSAAFSHLVTTTLHSLSRLQLQLDTAIHQIYTNDHNLRSENKRLKQKLIDTIRQQQRKSQCSQPNHKVVSVVSVDTCIQPTSKPYPPEPLDSHSKRSPSTSSSSTLLQLEKQNTELQRQLLETKHELEAAIREAATQRRRASNQQQQNGNHQQYGSMQSKNNNSSSYQSNSRQLNILKNRIRVLEIHNIKLRVANKALAEEKFNLESSNNNKNNSKVGRSSGGNGGNISTCDADQEEEEEESNDTNISTQVAVQKWEADKKLKDQLDAARSKLRATATRLSSSEASNALLKGQVDRLERELVSEEGRIKYFTHRFKQAEAAAAAGSGPGSISVDKLKEIFDNLDHLQQDKRDLERKVLELTVSLSSLSSSSSSSDQSDNIKNAHQQEYEPRRYSDEDCTVIVHHNGTTNGTIDGTIDGTFDGAPHRNDDSQWLRASNFQTANAPPQLPLDATMKKVDDDSKGNKPPSNNRSNVELMELEKQQALEETRRMKSYLKTLLSILSTTFSNNNSSRRRQSPRTCIPKQNDGIQKAIEKLKLEVERFNKQGGGEGSLTVSSTKYMQVVNKCRTLKVQIDRLTADLDRKHLESGDSQKYKQRVVELAAALGELRSRNIGAAAKRQCESTALLTAREEIMNAQVAELERALAERDAQLSYLYQGGAVSQLQTLLREGLRPRDLVEELMSARQQVKELRKEMENKRRETREERNVGEAAAGVVDDDDNDNHDNTVAMFSDDDD